MSGLLEKKKHTVSMPKPCFFKFTITGIMSGVDEAAKIAPRRSEMNQEDLSKKKQAAASMIAPTHGTQNPNQNIAF